MRHTVPSILEWMKSMENRRNVEGMARFGIKSVKAYGLSTPVVRKKAKEIGQDHDLALELYPSGYHEARVLAVMIDDPEKVTRGQMDDWARQFESWADCDVACYTLFDQTPYALDKIAQWSKRSQEFIKRGAFSMIAGLAVHDKSAPDKIFEELLPIIARECTDERNFVKKAVNWALREVGKRNIHLNKLAIDTAKKIREKDSRAARWIAADALRESTNEKVQVRLRNRK